MCPRRHRPPLLPLLVFSIFHVHTLLPDRYFFLLPGWHPPLLSSWYSPLCCCLFSSSHIRNFLRHLCRIVWEGKESVCAFKFHVNYLPVCMPNNVVHTRFPVLMIYGGTVKCFIRFLQFSESLIVQHSSNTCIEILFAEASKVLFFTTPCLHLHSFSIHHSFRRMFEPPATADESNQSFRVWRKRETTCRLSFVLKFWKGSPKCKCLNVHLN